MGFMLLTENTWNQLGVLIVVLSGKSYYFCALMQTSLVKLWTASHLLEEKQVSVFYWPAKDKWIWTGSENIYFTWNMI